MDEQIEIRSNELMSAGPATGALKKLIAPHQEKLDSGAIERQTCATM